MHLQDRYSIVKLTIAGFSFLWLMVLLVPTAYAHSYAHVTSDTASKTDNDTASTTQIRTESDTVVTFFKFVFEDHTLPVDGCLTDCCRILAGAKVLTNTKFNDENSTYAIGSINLLPYCLKSVSSSKFVYLLSSQTLHNTLQFRVLLI